MKFLTCFAVLLVAATLAGQTIPKDREAYAKLVVDRSAKDDAGEYAKSAVEDARHIPDAVWQTVLAQEMTVASYSMEIGYERIELRKKKKLEPLNPESLRKGAKERSIANDRDEAVSAVRWLRLLQPALPEKVNTQSPDLNVVERLARIVFAISSLDGEFTGK